MVLSNMKGADFMTVEEARKTVNDFHSGASRDEFMFTEAMEYLIREEKGLRIC